MAQIQQSQLALNTITQALVNAKDSAGGPSIPPKQFGQFQIPFVTNLRLGPVSRYFGGTQYTLLWDEPTNTTNISHYNIYVVGALLGNKTPLGPFSAEGSPANFRVTASAAGLLTFFVQTQLNNGNVSDLGSSPSCTAQASVPQIQTGDIMAGTIYPGLALSVSDISGNYTALESDSLIYIDTSSGAVNVTAMPNPSTGQKVVLKKITNDANTVTFLANTGQTVETGGSFSNAFGSMTFTYRSKGASIWQIVAKY